MAKVNQITLGSMAYAKSDLLAQESPDDFRSLLSAEDLISSATSKNTDFFTQEFFIDVVAACQPTSLNKDQ